ncbi:MAG: hypothetical protein Aureis2KO_25170 [Aureisphaera sp.]
MVAQNQSLNFDGIDDYVDLGDNYAFEITDTFSVEAWVKFDTPGLKQIVSKLGIEEGTFRGWGLQITSAGRLSGYISTEFFNDYIFITGNSDFLFDNNWHHVAMTFDGAGSLLLYVDGLPESFTSSGGGTVTNIQTTSNTHIGNYAGNGTPGEFFFGNIDDVRIWDSARSATEIEDNYLTELSGNEANLIGYYKFDNSDTTCDVQDCSPSGFHGTRDGSIGANDKPQFSEDIPVLVDVDCGVETGCQLSLEDFDQNLIALFPNPTHGTITLSGLTSEISSIQVVNALGQTITEFSSQGMDTLDISELATGMYFLLIELESNQVVTKKVIKK